MRIATVFAAVFTGMVLAIAGTDRPAFAARFDCASAQLPAEQTVCLDPQLSRLDDRYGAKYDSLLGQLSNLADQAEKVEVLDQAQSFLAKRDACGASTECIRQSYLDIFEYLSTAKNSPTDAPSDGSDPTTRDGVATTSPRAFDGARERIARPETEEDSASNRIDNANSPSASPSDVSPLQNAREGLTASPADLSASYEPTPDPAGTPGQNSTSASAPQAPTDADTPPPPTIAEASSISSPVSNARIEVWACVEQSASSTKAEKPLRYSGRSKPREEARAVQEAGA
jgi:uncharacterized protein